MLRLELPTRSTAYEVVGKTIDYKSEARLVLKLISYGDIRGKKDYTVACKLARRAWEILLPSHTNWHAHAIWKEDVVE